METAPSFQNLFTTSAGDVAHPFLLLEVRSAELNDSAIDGGCCVREHPFVKVEARVMKNQNDCALRVEATTSGAKSMAVPQWQEQFQVDYPAIERAELTLSLYKSKDKRIGEP